MPTKTVCWDWNGTLLDDVEVCRQTMNQVLREHGLPEMQDRSAYRQRFGFPIRSFYAEVGIGNDTFVDAARRYLELLSKQIGAAKLHHGAHPTLARLRDSGIRQILASATLPEPLKQQMDPHHVEPIFEEIVSIDDELAPSKAQVIAQWMTRTDVDPRNVIMVGDTNHDQEIAEGLGMRFIYFRDGHQELGTSTESIGRLEELIGVL